MQFHYDDGGRQNAGYKGVTGDCVTRAIAIALNVPYQKVYDDLNALGASMRQTKKVRSSNARTGVNRVIYDRYLKNLGWTFTPTMAIGSGCKVHMKDEELPTGRIIVRLSRHMAAVINGVLHDTYDNTRDGTRCVYGYYSKA